MLCKNPKCGKDAGFRNDGKTERKYCNKHCYRSYLRSVYSEKSLNNFVAYAYNTNSVFREIMGNVKRIIIEREKLNREANLLRIEAIELMAEPVFEDELPLTEYRFATRKYSIEPRVII